MFGKKNRRRAASNPPLSGPTNPSAATAAAQAFLKNQASNASLSNAAAAAALRSRPTTPTSVADVQTKRTIRRTGSVSSVGSSVAGSTRGQPRPQLERRGSSASMTERTFREPSPSRPVPSAPDAPPVPALPTSLQQSPMIPPKSHRRASSVEAPATRVASPPPNKANGRGSSLGGATQPPRRTNQRMSNLSSVSESERPGSRGSVNFSLPTGSRPTSPVAQRRHRLTSPSPQRANMARIVSPTNQSLIYDPNTRSFLPEAQIMAIEERIHSASEQPVKKKKRASPIAGTHLADGTAGGRPKGTFIDAAEAAERQKAIETPAPSGQSAPAPVAAPVQAPAVELVSEAPKKKKKKVAISDSESDQASYIPNPSDNDSDFTTKQSNTRAVAPLAKKPSIVREDEERENEGNDTLKGTQNLAVLNGTPDSRQASPSPLPRSSVAGRGHGRGQASASTAFAQGRQKARSASQPAPKQDSPANGVGSASRDSVRGGRVASVSPMRTTHFAPSPDSLIVKHDPPARSISPRKSAMKHSNSPHATSPNEGFHEHSFSETSNGSAVQSEGLTPRKKANRVSFDETNVVVGQAATPAASDSPIILSPQTKSKWFSIGRGKKKESAVSEDDEIMKPRPALPSFGSVREKKPVRDLEERPLVKPTEHSEARLPPASPPLFTSPTGETIENPFGQSNDHGAGAVILQDFASKNTANISKSREPLPPQVTSVDGNGEISGSDSSLYSVEDRKPDIGLARGNSIKRGPEDGNADTYRALASPVSHEFEAPTAKGESEAMNGINVPEINILSATPIIASAEPGQAWPDIPGSWAKENSDSSNQEQEEISLVEHHPTEPTVAEVGIAEPDPTTPRAGSPVLGEIAAYNSIAEEPEESDSSIYSDAAEDFSDIEGSGFMSLDAVVTTPVKINTEMTGLAISTPPESPTTQTTKQKAYQRSQLSRQSSEPDINQGWDKVQAYWSTLSAEKKRQLEEEARDEAEGSDTEVEAKPAPKPKKKNKVAVRAGTAQPEPDIQQPVSNDRSYMIQPGAKAGPNGHAPMKSSMRSEPANNAPEPHIRKSMRGSGSMRGTLREGAEPTGSLQKKNRPASQPPVSRPDPIEVQKHIRTLSAASAATAQSADTKRHTAPAPALRRKNSGDSDTSFKRSNKHGNEIPSFRNSMRGSVDSPQSAAPRPQSSRFSLRSLSPTGSAFRRPFNSGAAPQANLSETHMRNSMRSSNSITPSLRNNPPAKKSSGFGRSAPVKQNKQQKPTRRLISRFADSSDEDEDTPRFQSRFNDSSDDDDGPPLPLPSAVRTMRNSTNAPVRGIPKRTGVNDGDSSDLPDSDDEKTPRLPKIVKNQNGISLNTTKASALASGSLRRSGSGRGTISAPPVALPGTDAPIRPNNPSRGSFMSILRRKKDTGSGGRVRKSDAESAARRDTPLERNKFDLQALRLESTQSPRLQKRNTMSRENSASWPLPGPGNGVSAHTGASQSQRVLVGKESEDARPFTADGPGGVVESPNGDLGANADGRPDIGSRRFTATGLANVDVANLSFAGANGGERKKKKFGKLRKMFRLDD